MSDLQTALDERRPLIDLIGLDQSRALAGVRWVAAQRWPDLVVRVWTASEGFLPPLAGEPRRDSLAEALRSLLTADEGGVVVLAGPLPDQDTPAVRRLLLDCYYAWRERDDRLLVRLTRGDAGLDLEPQVTTVQLGLPSLAELREAVSALPRPEDHEELAAALTGVSWEEAWHVLAGLRARPELDRDLTLRAVFEAKSRAVSRCSALRFVPPDWSLEDMGGLGRLKEWLSRRAGSLTPAAVAEGRPTPHGILLMGVSGCGKSFAAKAVSSLWAAPLFRLDMGAVFAGVHGSPESVFQQALAQVEAAAPCVLWIDEIENGLGGTEGDRSDERLFSSFLTWLQEKPPLVFVAATANRIELLPPELLRKGRFDQVFFCDLPSPDERREILEIHLRRHGADPAQFRLDFLVLETKGWSGAELEQLVAGARLEAHADGRGLEERDLARSARGMVPLSRTMHEKIRALREWAHGRAVPASAGEDTP